VVVGDHNIQQDLLLFLRKHCNYDDGPFDMKKFKTDRQYDSYTTQMYRGYYYWSSTQTAQYNKLMVVGWSVRVTIASE
jgi:hypothetical protein